MTSGKIYLQKDLYGWCHLDINYKPIVFLNMCESGWVVPNWKDFIHAFLNKGASCVIGTECAMTSTFAFPFAKLVFEDLLNGDGVGMAALKATRHFMKEQWHSPWPCLHDSRFSDTFIRATRAKATTDLATGRKRCLKSAFGQGLRWWTKNHRSKKYDSIGGKSQSSH